MLTKSFRSIWTKLESKYTIRKLLKVPELCWTGVAYFLGQGALTQKCLVIPWRSGIRMWVQECISGRIYNAEMSQNHIKFHQIDPNFVCFLQNPDSGFIRNHPVSGAPEVLLWSPNHVRKCLFTCLKPKISKTDMYTWLLPAQDWMTNNQKWSKARRLTQQALSGGRQPKCRLPAAAFSQSL